MVGHEKILSGSGGSAKHGKSGVHSGRGRLQIGQEGEDFIRVRSSPPEPEGEAGLPEPASHGQQDPYGREGLLLRRTPGPGPAAFKITGRRPNRQGADRGQPGLGLSRQGLDPDPEELPIKVEPRRGGPVSSSPRNETTAACRRAQGYGDRGARKRGLTAAVFPQAEESRDPDHELPTTSHHEPFVAAVNMAEPATARALTLSLGRLPSPATLSFAQRPGFSLLTVGGSIGRLSRVYHPLEVQAMRRIAGHRRIRDRRCDSNVG